MKKVANEKLRGWLRRKGFVDLRTSGAQEEAKRIKAKLSVSIFDYFYQMRIRLNYRDFAFVEQVPSSDTKAYFQAYFDGANSVCGAMKTIANDLSACLPIS